MHWKIVFSVLCLHFGLHLPASAQIQCKDEKGDNVDWFIAYKLPILKKNLDPIFRKGLGYIYLTPNRTEWMKSSIAIDNPNSMIGRSLLPIYQNKYFSITYNDERPGGKVNQYRGHTKGVVLGDASGGIWLVHSVPRFPNVSTYIYPESGRQNGQTFLCLSLNSTNLDAVGIQLLYNEPDIYFNRTASLEKLYPSLTDAINRKFVRKAPYTSRKSLLTIGGKDFVSYAKTRKFGKDIYEDWLTQEFGSTLLVETWQNGRGKLPSNCTKPAKVYNVKTVNIPALDNFNSTSDHSKWAVTINGTASGKYWICIGDINRVQKQFQRGGGTVCTSDKSIWIQFSKIVTEIESCSRPTQKQRKKRP